MDAIARAMSDQVAEVLQLCAKVTTIRQDNDGVSVTWRDTASGDVKQSHADWCLCTIPLSVLSQIDMNVSPAMTAAINAVPYAASVKIGLQFRRRFWEENDGIYGGISYTDRPITQIGYPAHGYLGRGKGVLLGAYCFGPYAYEFTALDPAEWIRRAVAEAPKSIRNIQVNSTVVSPLGGIASHGFWAASANGLMKPGRPIIGTCVR